MENLRIWISVYNEKGGEVKIEVGDTDERGWYFDVFGSEVDYPLKWLDLVSDLKLSALKLSSVVSKEIDDDKIGYKDDDK
uniref:Uncharacterized protein n=1 Tax=viral metagenome TaxID=1070528 RepID=A0A6M3LBS0_9ZZZZ